MVKARILLLPSIEDPRSYEVPVTVPVLLYLGAGFYSKSTNSLRKLHSTCPEYQLEQRQLQL